MFVFPAKKDKSTVECPVCHITGCYKHCKWCGKNIYFRKNDYGRYQCYEEATSTYHKCEKYGKRSEDKERDTRYMGIGKMFDKAIILTKDSQMLKVEKMKIQRKLQGADSSGLTAVERYFRDLDPELRKKYIEDLRKWSQ